MVFLGLQNTCMNEDDARNKRLDDLFIRLAAWYGQQAVPLNDIP